MSTLTPTQEVLEAGAWQADPAHSRVEFALDYMTGTFRGSFSPFQATLEVGPDGAATLRGSASAADVKVQDENLTAHLQSPEFFDAERTPALTFESSRVAREGDRLTVDGTLAVKGVSQPVALAGPIGGIVVDPHGRERLGVRLEGRVDRRDFGLTWNASLPSGEPALANEVSLAAELYLVRA